MIYKMNISQNLFLLLSISIGTRSIAENIEAFAPIIDSIAPQNFYPHHSPKKRTLLFCAHMFREIMRSLEYGLNGISTLSKNSRYFTIANEIIVICSDTIQDVLRYTEDI